MKNNIKNREVTVLLVSDNTENVHEVKACLKKITNMPYRIWHCSDIPQICSLLRENPHQADIVLLDMNLVSSMRPRDLFSQMGDVVGHLPIIVFTEKEDRELALLLIEDGAVDNVTRGQLESDSLKLKDAIEFSLARDEISRDRKRESIEALGRLGKRDAALLRKQKDKNTALLKEKDDTIFWMSGGYSVDASDPS